MRAAVVFAEIPFGQGELHMLLGGRTSKRGPRKEFEMQRLCTPPVTAEKSRREGVGGGVYSNFL